MEETYWHFDQESLLETLQRAASGEDPHDIILDLYESYPTVTDDPESAPEVVLRVPSWALGAICGTAATYLFLTRSRK